MNKLAVLCLYAFSVTMCFVFIPGTMGFLELWCGAVFGASIHSIFQFFGRYQKNQSISVALEFGSDYRFSQSLGVKLVVTSIMSLSAIVGLIPDMVLADKEMRILNNIKIESIDITMEKTGQEVFIPNASLTDIESYLKHAKVYYPSHESSSRYFKLEIHTGDGILKYDASFPEKHVGDIRLSFNRWFTYSNILVPGLGKYLERMNVDTHHLHPKQP